MAASPQLRPQQRRLLQDRGYLVLRSLLDQAALTRVRDRLDEIVRRTVGAWADEPGLDTTEGCVMAEFHAADPDFLPCHQHPLLADAAARRLGSSAGALQRVDVGAQR